MPKFAEMLAGIAKDLDGLIKPEMSTDEISKITSIKTNVQALEQPYKDIESEAIKSKEKYIEVIKGYGTPTPPPEDDGQGKSLEQCIDEVIAQRKN